MIEYNSLDKEESANIPSISISNLIDLALDGVLI